MERKYTNPAEDIDSRPFYPLYSKEFASMKELLFSELTENTTIYYCVKDQKHHQGSDCRLKTRWNFYVIHKLCCSLF